LRGSYNMDMKNSNKLPDVLVTETINAGTLQNLAGYLLAIFKGCPEMPLADEDVCVDLLGFAENFGRMTLQSIRDQGVSLDSSDPVDFEVPVYVVSLIAGLLRKLEANPSPNQQPWVAEVISAWKPFARAALRVTLEWEADRKEFEASWSAS